MVAQIFTYCLNNSIVKFDTHFNSTHEVYKVKRKRGNKNCSHLLQITEREITVGQRTFSAEKLFVQGIFKYVQKKYLGKGLMN